MKNLKDFYILGLPIETSIGLCYFPKVRDYPEIYYYLSVMSMSRLKIILNFESNNKDEEFIKELKKNSLFNIVSCFLDLKLAYKTMFSIMFKDENVFNKITEQDFEEYRNLILEMNCIKEEKINPNPEIQRWIEKSKKYKQIDNEGLSFSDIVTSVVGYNGIKYDDVNEMTIYQLYSTFYRICKIKGYDTSTLYSTVSVKKMKVESWCGHIDLFAEESNGISRDDFNKKTSNLFDK